MPFERATGSRLAERDADDVDDGAENITPFPAGKINYPFLEVRVTVDPCPKPNTAYH
jgi:hypothetical protein